MEEIVALLIQFVLEVGLQLFGSIGIDATTRRSEEENGGCGWLVSFAVFGGLVGAISLIFAPNLLLPTPALRVANLIVAPIIAGGLSYLVVRYVWTQRGWEPSHHFWRAFWFALVFGMVRFAYAHR